MRKITLKTLLVAAALSLGTNAWAQTRTDVVYEEDFESYSAVADISDWKQENGTLSLIESDGNKYLQEATVGSGSRGAWYNGSLLENGLSGSDNFIVEYDCNIGTGTNTTNMNQGTCLVGATYAKTSYAANPDWGYPATNIAGVSCGSNSSTYTLYIGGTSIETGIALDKTKWYHYKYELSCESDVYTLSVTITEVGSETPIVAKSAEIDYASYGTLKQIYIQAGRGTVSETNHTGITCIDNIKVTKEVSAEFVNAPIATLTGVDGVNRIITMSSNNESADIYYYKSTETEDDAVKYEGPVTISETTTFNMYAKSGTNVSETVASDAFEAGVAISLNGVTYTKGEYDSALKQTAITLNTDQSSVLLNPTAQIVYQIDDNDPVTVENGAIVNLPDLSTIKYHAIATGYLNSVESTLTAEASILEGKTIIWTSSDYEKLNTATADEILITSIEAGQVGSTTFYTLERPNDAGSIDADRFMATPCSSNWLLRGLNRGLYNSNAATLAIKDLHKGDAVVFEGAYGNAAFVIGSGVNSSLKEWESTTGSRYVYEITEDGTATFSMERYGYLKRIYIYTNASYSASVDGYATFSYVYDVDFSAEDGLTIYTAKLNDEQTTVTLNEVADKKVPAGAGVILKGNGTFTGVVTTGVAALENNSLVASTERTVSQNDGIYVLNKVNDEVGFYLFEGTLSAGKAHLEISGGNAKSISVDFGGATGISNVESARKADGAIYTLSGVRVEKPVKGLYIQNGKKVIVK